MSHSSILLIPPSKTSRSSLHISHSPTVSSALYCFATRAHMFIFLLLTTGMPLSSFGQVQVPYTKSLFQHLRVVHWAVQIRFHSYEVFLFLTRCLSLEFSSTFTLFLIASLSLVYTGIIYCASVLYPPNLSMDGFSYRFPPISFGTFSTTLSHLIPARPLVTLSRTALSYSWQPLFWNVPYFILPLCHK